MDAAQQEHRPRTRRCRGTRVRAGPKIRRGRHGREGLQVTDDEIARLRELRRLTEAARVCAGPVEYDVEHGDLSENGTIIAFVEPRHDAELGGALAAALTALPALLTAAEENAALRERVGEF